MTTASGVSVAVVDPNKLKRRVATALCLGLVALGFIYLLPPPWFALAFAGVALLAAWEWGGFLPQAAKLHRILYAAALAALLAATYLVSALQVWALWLSLAVWAAAILGILAYPAGASVWGRPGVAGLLGVLIIWRAWAGVVAVRAQPQGQHWLVWLFVLVSAVDIGAYFAGKAFGARKLAPTLSPGKTWEGLSGGVLTGLLVCGGALVAFSQASWSWLGVTLALIAVAVFGDLLESLLKRQTGMKDSGALLPGHGGLLDRLDSALAVLPIFALALPRL